MTFPAIACHVLHTPPPMDMWQKLLKPTKQIQHTQTPLSTDAHLRTDMTPVLPLLRYTTSAPHHLAQVDLGEVGQDVVRSGV